MKDEEYKYRLSIVLDKDGNNRLDLYKTKTLQEMDNFLEGFKNSQDVREKYLTDISEFLMDSKDRIHYLENKNNRKFNGSICLLYCENKNIDKISIIYKDGPALMPLKECFSKISKELEKDEVLKNIYHEKKYILSEECLMFLGGYLNRKYQKDKEYFIKNFLLRLKTGSDNYKYLVCRALMNICNLIEPIEIKNLKIYNTDKLYEEMTLVKSSEEIEKERRDSSNIDAPAYFRMLLESGNYEELHNVFTIEEIDKYSSYYKR